MKKWTEEQEQEALALWKYLTQREGRTHYYFDDGAIGVLCNFIVATKQVGKFKKWLS